MNDNKMNLHDSDILNEQIDAIKGIGSARKALFSRLGIITIGDLTDYYPRDYQNRGDPKTLNSLIDGEYALVTATADSRVDVRYKRRNMSLQRMKISDPTGHALVIWFNQPFLRNYFSKGETYTYFGKVAKKEGATEIVSPEYMRTGDADNGLSAGIVPIYRLTEGLSQNIVRNAVTAALSMTDDAGGIPETLPAWVTEKYSLITKDEAVRAIHRPQSVEWLARAKRRLAFEELLGLHIYVAGTRLKTMMSIKKYVSKDTALPESFIASLPFKLTAAQLKAYADTARDMEGIHPMNRLIQGDVGSGKTMVALLALLKAAGSGYQGVIMAPTEILAVQHHSNISHMLAGTRIKTALITGAMKDRQRSEILRGIKEGEIQIIIGTHALLRQDVEFARLAVAVTDEQHRFGVRQRAGIALKSENPDILALSATPIPRTLALALYGDVDISVIDEMPPGRKPVKTYSVTEEMRDRINGFIRRTVAEGHQAYVVCPLVEAGTEGSEAQAAVELSERIAAKDLAGLKVGLLHGKMATDMKKHILKDFQQGVTDVLVCTTVVEVGIDIPNATLMVIENAERYGLAQLHQLRGRVGRSDSQSWCVIYNQGTSAAALKRMEAIQKYNDGFIIAEKDLELRGPGDFFGTRQHGIPELRVANLYEDADLMQEAGAAAVVLVEKAGQNGPASDGGEEYYRRCMDMKGWFW